MLLTLGLSLALQAPGKAPVTPPATVRADSIARETARRASERASRSATRRPVSSADSATAYKDPSARMLLTRARQARVSQDSMLTGYDAMTYQRLSAGIGFSKLGRDRLIFRTERADRIRWQRDVGLWIDVKGARTVMPGVPGVAQSEVQRDLANEGDMAPVPYYPGYEPLWMGFPMSSDSFDTEAGGPVDELGPVHPLSEGSEAYYTYRTGDSLSMTLDAGRIVRLRELEVRPRVPKWNLVVGSLWFDLESGQLVRAAYRFAVPMHVDAFVNEQDPHAFDDVPAVLKPAMFPMHGEITAVTIEYGIYGGHFWLPRVRVAEGAGTASFVRVPFKLEQTFKYAAVNGTEKLPPVPLPPPPARRAQPPDSLDLEGKLAWRDSVAAVRLATAKARRDSITSGLLVLPPRVRPCDTSVTVTTTSRRFGTARIPVATTTPCDPSTLVNSPDLPKSIFDPDDELFDTRAREALMTEALSMGVQPPVILDPRLLPPPTVLYGLQLTRFNRVEGLSTGLSVEQNVGGGYAGSLVGRFGVSDRIPNLEVAVTRSNLARSVFLSGYSHLVSASDWGNPLSFGSSVSAALFGRDEGFYYRAAGLSFGGRTEHGAQMDWRVFAERQRSARPTTEFSLLGNNATSNIVASTGTYVGLAARARGTHGDDPHGFQLFSDVRVEGAAGDSTYLRGAVDFSVARDFHVVAAALTVSGGSSVGALPTQREWYLGGTRTIRGQTPDVAHSGSAYWMVRGELGRTIQGARPVIFGDIGWVGDRNRIREVGLPMSGVGAGLSILEGLIRFDVARGLNPKQQWRIDCYLEGVF